MLKRKRADAAIARAYSLLNVKGVEDDRRVIRGIATTPTPDRVGDIVESEGVTFKNPLPLLHQHNHASPVGTVTFSKPTKDGIVFEAKFAKIDEPGPLRDRIETAWGEVKAGLVRGVSIGFRTLEYSVMDDGGYRFVESEVLELSLVTIPANQDATITSIKSFDRKSRLNCSAAKARVGAPESHNLKNGSPQMTKISEQISALESEKENIKKALKKFDINDMDESDEERFDDLSADLEAIDKKLGRLHRIEAIDIDKAVEVKDVKKSTDAAQTRSGNRVLGPNSNVPKGIPFARKVRCLALAKGSEEVAAQIAEREYPDDPRIATSLRVGTTKAAVPGAYTGDSGGWAEDIAEAQTLTTEFVEYLRPMTIVDRINGLRRVPFNIKVPRLTTGQSGYWVGEAKPAPMTSGVFDTVTLGKTKVGAISALTKEQIRFSNISAETAIRDDLARAVVARMDTTFISTAAASAGVSPAGLLNGLSAISANGSGAVADIRSDIQDLFAPFAAANISRKNMVLVMHENLHLALMLTHDNGFRAFPDITADGGSILGIPVVASNHVAAGDVIMISASDILLADDGEVTVEMSDETSLEMLDGSLEQDGTDGTGATTAGLVSMFQTGMVAIKIERFINWQKARAASVAYIGDAGWNGAATA